MVVSYKYKENMGLICKEVVMEDICSHKEDICCHMEGEVIWKYGEGSVNYNSKEAGDTCKHKEDLNSKREEVVMRGGGGDL